LNIESNTTAAPMPTLATRISQLHQPAELVLALIDHSRLRRECLKLAMTQHDPRWHVVDAATASEILTMAEAGQTFDLLLIGAATSEHVALGEIETLRDALPGTPVAVTTESDNPQRARLILGAGARGFLPASLSLKVMMGALDLVLAGGIYVPSSLIEPVPERAVAASEFGAAGECANGLTRRQRDVLGLISKGKSNKLIADALTMSESTVKAHVKQIIKRLRVANRTQAALLANGVFAQGALPAAMLEPSSRLAHLSVGR
jgi:DNA-binding NarL/FixJ family response regulator